MYGREKRVLLRHFLKQGLAKTAVAEKLGVSRRTVYHWIETGQLDRELDDEAVRYRPRPPIPRKVDPYRGIIHSRLEEFPELSAVRLYEEIRAAGYEGSYTQVKEYVRQVRPRPEAEPLVRFETPPGHQAQVDFAHFRLPWGAVMASFLQTPGYADVVWRA
jgi:transposase